MASLHAKLECRPARSRLGRRPPTKLAAVKRSAATQKGARTGALAALALLWATLGACEERPELPPEKPREQAAPLAVDPHHTLTFRADRTITLTQIVLVLQRDPLDSNSLGFSLTTLRPGPDGSRMIFGAFVTADSLAGLTKSPIPLTSSAFLNPNGNGIFIGADSYQPKLAALEVNSINDREAEGSFTGDFYYFAATRPGPRPEVVRAGGTFRAAVIVR